MKTRAGKVWWGLMAVSLALGAFVYWDQKSFWATPLPPLKGGAVLVIPAGTGLQPLVIAFWGDDPIGAFRARVYLKIRGGSRLKAGEYGVTPGMTPQQLLAHIMAGRVVQYPLAVVEGWRFSQLRHALSRHPKITQTLADASDAEIMARLGRPGLHPEGRFFPDTYHFPAGTTDVEVLKRAMRTLDQHLAEVWEHRDPTLALKTPDEVLILASIIEKETAKPEERALIAGVFLRRLQIGMPLQTDPTVIYGVGDRFDGRLRKPDLTTDTPYNTYTRKGLPPTPIALPGVAALRATVHPAVGEALYFVANGQGGHVFSNTYEAHQRQVAQFQR